MFFKDAGDFCKMQECEIKQKMLLSLLQNAGELRVGIFDTVIIIIARRWGGVESTSCPNKIFS